MESGTRDNGAGMVTPEEMDKLNIIRGLGGMFFATYCVDIERDSFQVITQRERVGEILGDKVKYTEGIRTYAENFMHPDDRDIYLETMNVQNLRNQLRTDHTLIAVEYRANPYDKALHQGDIRWIRATVILTEIENGRPIHALYVAQDITDTREQEEKEHQALREACDAAHMANEAKSSFLSRMSHDIRTPLNAIIGITKIAQMHLDDRERVTDCLNKITASSRQLLALINEVLDMSKIEAGKMDLAEDEFSVPDVVKNVQTFILPQAEKKQLNVQYRFGRMEHENVIGDVVRLQQVVTNIMSNSVKYTPAGGSIQLYIEERPSRLMGYGCFEIVCSDTGIGMDEEFVSHIFEPFSRAEDSRVSSEEGTGLGMAIARNIVYRMNGDIHVKSKLGEGSTFTVTVYLKLQEPVKRDTGVLQELHGKESDPKKVLGGRPFLGRTVLLVEDNELNLEIAEEFVSYTGARVECARNGKQAVESFKRHPANYYDMILMDIQMPVMNGYEASNAIRSSGREDSGRIPIIAMTANAFSEDIAASARAGMNAHIAKPLNISKLMGCMSQWMGRTDEDISAAKEKEF